MFITRFGVVKVIADDRLPPKHHTTKRARKDHVQRFDQAKHSYVCKQREAAENMYTGGRKRRQALQKMYESMHHYLRVPKTDNEVEQFSAPDIWKLYCHTLSTRQILHDNMSWKDVNGDPYKDHEVDTFNRTDPRLAKDFHHSRIVECELVCDERICRSSNNVQGETSQQKAITPKVRIFLARSELSQRYDRASTRYVCSDCGKSFSIKLEWKQHLAHKLCFADSMSQKDKRSQALKIREDNLSGDENDTKTFLSSIHAVMKPRAVDVEFGNPCKVSKYNVLFFFDLY